MNKPTYIRIYKNGGSYTQYFIQHGKQRTPSNSCVEYEDFYEIVMYNWWNHRTWLMRICKKTLEITGNFRDVNVYEKVYGQWAEVY